MMTKELVSWEIRASIAESKHDRCLDELLKLRIEVLEYKLEEARRERDDFLKESGSR